jgi:hypothetical protein
MRVGSLHIDARTAKGLYYAAVMFPFLVCCVGVCILVGIVMSPGAQETPMSLWRAK